MKKFALVLAVALLCSTFAFAGGQTESASAATSTASAAPSTIKIGFIGPLTGDYANYGTRCRDSLILAAEQRNAKGGINGAQIQIIAEDSEGSPEKALAAIEKLASSDKISGLIGPVLSGETQAVADYCQERKIVLISPSASQKDITNTGDYIFRTTPSDGLQSEVAGLYFSTVLGYKNVAVLYAKNDYSQGLYEGMKEAFEANGGKVVIAESCSVGDKDFKTQLTKIKAANPEAIYIPNYTAEMAQILEQANQLGMNIPFLSGDGFTSPEIYELAGAFTDGVIYIGPAQTEAAASYAAFESAYKARFSIDPDSFATNAFDASNILFDAIASVGTDSAKIRDKVASTANYEGVLGKVSFAANGDIMSTQSAFKVNGTTPECLGTYSVSGGKLISAN